MSCLCALLLWVRMSITTFSLVPEEDRRGGSMNMKTRNQSQFSQRNAEWRMNHQFQVNHPFQWTRFYCTKLSKVTAAKYDKCHCVFLPSPSMAFLRATASSLASKPDFGWMVPLSPFWRATQHFSFFFKWDFDSVKRSIGRTYFSGERRWGIHKTVQVLLKHSNNEKNK